jgi:hypothetical protein
MNSLSWLIYLSEVTGSISGVFAGLSAFGFVVVIFGFILHMVIKEQIWPDGKYWVLIPIAAMFISAVIPSKKTVMMIAASEYGEKIIKSKAVEELADPAMDLLKTWIASENARLKAATTEKK